MFVSRSTVELRVTNPDLIDLDHLCLLDSINFAQFRPISYVSVGSVVLPFLGHLRTAKSLTDRHRSAQMPGIHGVIGGKGSPTTQ